MLVYFAVSKLGEKPIDGKTDVNPEGMTAAHGKHAAAVADRLAAGGLSCKVHTASVARCTMPAQQGCYGHSLQTGFAGCRLLSHHTLRARLDGTLFTQRKIIGFPSMPPPCTVCGNNLNSASPAVPSSLCT